MAQQDGRLDPREKRARDRVLAWFRIPASRRGDALSSPGAFERVDTDTTMMIGTIVCLIYAMVWLVGWTPSSWWTGSTAFFNINDQPPIPVRIPSYRTGKFVPWGFAGCFIFLTAPFMRAQSRNAQRICALGIFIMCAEGGWLLLRGLVTSQGVLSFGQAILWVIVPLGIAAWVLLGPPNPGAEAREARMYERRQAWVPGTSIVIGVAALVLVLLALFVLFQLPFP